MPSSISYHEPSIVTILVLTSFLILSNVINSILNRLVHCGLIGQILLGVAWGEPGGKWLSTQAQTAIVQFGYLDLILIVYEGGLHTSLASLKSTLPTATLIATTGIALPLALSFLLIPLASASAVQAFAAGAALCSTSLGTTFTILAASGLSDSRLGSLLSTAAMLDDVVGLVMVRVVQSLGEGDVGAGTVVRPVFVSVGFAVGVPVACWLVVGPVTRWFRGTGRWQAKWMRVRFCSAEQGVFLVHTAVLVALVVAASYAGTSNLFAAYLAGACISWWDGEFACGPELEHGRAADGNRGVAGDAALSIHPDKLSGVALFEQYYQQPLNRILTPFFFASIGFSIPISRMFSGRIVWRGIVYTILMLIGKLSCGFWLLNFARPRWLRLSSRRHKAKEGAEDNELAEPEKTTTTAASPRTESGRSQASPVAKTASPIPKPSAIPYPALILGSAMVARGEIGFLISSIAESSGVFAPQSGTSSSEGESQIFLIVTWAIGLCTIIGPFATGLLVKRMNKSTSVADGRILAAPT